MRYSHSVYIWFDGRGFFTNSRCKQFFMKHTTLITLIAGLTFLVSCAPKKDKSEVIKSYDLIYSSFIYSKDAQQKFIDKTVESLNTIKNDKNASVDTKKLAVLLDGAKMANNSRLPIINRADEIDENIMYKEKVLKYVNLLNSLYDKEFEDYIKILDTQTEDRFEKSSQMLLPRLTELDKVGNACTEAGQQIRSKYDIQVTDLSPKLK